MFLRQSPASASFGGKQWPDETAQRTTVHIPVMSSFSALMPSGARTMLSICRPSVSQGPMAAPALPVYQQVRGIARNKQAMEKRKRDKAARSVAKGKNKGPREFRQKNLKDVEQFALCDAIR